jgi:large subunit ribosomal protein L32
MAHPKRKISKTRRDKRTHYKATVAQIATCQYWWAHLYHRAYWHEGKMYYRGQVVIDKSVAVAMHFFFQIKSELSFEVLLQFSLK